MKKLIFTCFVMVLTVMAIGQKTITGTITDETGETLIGVNILEKGTSTEPRRILMVLTQLL